MPKPTGEEIASHYLSAHARLRDLASTLTDGDLATDVPSTPGWTVHDVVAHLAAVTTDALSGRLTGMPTDEFTAGQVADRRGRSIDELLTEWAGNVTAMADGARAGLVPPQLSVDALTHEQDVRGALKREPAIAADELRFCLEIYAVGLDRKLRALGLAPVEVRAGDSEFTVSAGDREQAAAATVTASTFELFRAMSGRRGRTQVAGYDWTGEAAAYVEAFNLFGPLPSAAITD